MYNKRFLNRVTTDPLQGGTPFTDYTFILISGEMLYERGGGGGTALKIMKITFMYIVDS